MLWQLELVKMKDLVQEPMSVVQVEEPRVFEEFVSEELLEGR